MTMFPAGPARTERLPFDPFPAGVTRLDLDDIAKIKVSRNDRRTITYKSTYGNQTETPYSAESAARFYREVAERKLKIISVKREPSCRIVIVLRDGRELPMIDLFGAESEAFWKGQYQPAYSSTRQACFEPWGINYLLMDEDKGLMARIRLEVPREILQAAIAQVPLANYSESRGTFYVGDRHRRFWKPTVRVDMDAETLQAYRANWDVSRPGERNLRDQMKNLVNIARNLSRNRKNPGILHIRQEGKDLRADGSEGPRSFNWWTESGTGKRGMNGGLIYHANYANNQRLDTGGYSVHT